MNCWKTVNLSREYGANRIYLVSLLNGMLSFIILYLAFSMIHQPGTFKDHGLFPLLLGIAALPALHKLIHILTLISIKKRVKIRLKKKFGFIPSLSFLTKSKMSKSTSLAVLLAPTFCLTVVGILSSYFFAEYYVYFLIFTAVNVGCSSTDYLYIHQMLKAPKRCVIENARDGYDILVQRM